MSGLIHKYIRRLVVWAQTPSEDEFTAATLQRDMRDARSILKNRDRPVTLKRHQGMKRSDVINMCEVFFMVWKADGDISEFRAREACENICKTNHLDFVAMVRSGEIHIPASMRPPGIAA